VLALSINIRRQMVSTPRTTYSTILESAGRENRRAIEEERLVVRTVVVSFAKRPLNAAARPLPTAKWSQDIVLEGGGVRLKFVQSVGLMKILTRGC